jgi:hypothetical protein
VISYVSYSWSDGYLKKLKRKNNSVSRKKKIQKIVGTETENRNEINIFQKRNETERKKQRFLTPG